MGCEHFFKVGREIGDVHMLAVAGYLCADASLPTDENISLPAFKCPHRYLTVPSGSRKIFMALADNANEMISGYSRAVLDKRGGRRIAKLSAKLKAGSRSTAAFVAAVDREVKVYHGENPHQCFRLGLFTRIIELLANGTGRSYGSVIRWALLLHELPGSDDGTPWILQGEREFFNENFNIDRLRTDALLKALIDKCMPGGRGFSPEKVDVPGIEEAACHMARGFMPMLPDTIELEIERKPLIKEWKTRVIIGKYMPKREKGYVILHGGIPGDFDFKGKMRIYGLLKKLQGVPMQTNNQPAYDQLTQYNGPKRNSEKYQTAGCKEFCESLGIETEKTAGSKDIYFGPLQRCMEARVKLLKITFTPSSGLPVSS